MSETKEIKPIMLKTFTIDKNALNNLDVVASLDRGCSLTKIIYVDKKYEELLKDSKVERVPLTVALFPNTQFEIAITWMRDHGVFPDDKSLKMHLTGAGGVKHCEDVKRILERDVTFIDEFLSQSRGAYHLLFNVSINEITFPVEVPLKDYDIVNPFMSSLEEQFKKVVGDEVMNQPKEKILPCVFGFMGSGGGFTYINEIGKFRMVSGLPTAGKTFVGLSRCILGTNKYNEIMEMAERGNRKNVDSVIEDHIDAAKDWDLPLSLPIFTLGKLATTTKDISEFNKDDIAHSLVSMFAFNAMNAAIHVAMSEKVKNVFFGGNLFQGRVFRQEFEFVRRLFKVDYINFYFVNNGHTGALGAMVSEPSDLAKYIQM